MCEHTQNNIYRENSHTITKFRKFVSKENADNENVLCRWIMDERLPNSPNFWRKTNVTGQIFSAEDTVTGLGKRNNIKQCFSNKTWQNEKTCHSNWDRNYLIKAYNQKCFVYWWILEKFIFKNLGTSPIHIGTYVNL